MQQYKPQSRFRSLIIVFGLFVLTSSVLLAQDAPAGTLSIGKDLTYKRGTAVAKEEVLEFPYTHRNSSKESWAWVVHHERGARLICKEHEAEGVKLKKKAPENLVNQDFPADHKFQKTLDLIKQDAFLNVRKSFKGATSLDKEGWTVVGDGSAVCNLFYKDSTGRTFALLAIEEEGKEKLTGPPVAVRFERSKYGVLVSNLVGGNSAWSEPKVINPQTDVALNKVFSLLDKRNGF